MVTTPFKLPNKRQRIFVSPFGAKANTDIVKKLNLKQAEEKLKDEIPLEFRNSPVVYAIVVKINGEEYLKLGMCSRFFTTIQKNTGKQIERRYFSIIRDLRMKLGCEVKISKILSFIKEYSEEDGDLTLHDIESKLLRDTSKYFVNPGGEKAKLKEYRHYDSIKDVMQMVKEYIAENGLDAYVSD